MRIHLKNSWYLLRVHLKIGYALIIVLFDLAIASILASDFVVFSRMGLSIKTALNILVSTLVFDTILDTLALALILFLLLPTVLAAIRIMFGGGRQLRSILGIQHGMIVGTHCAVAVVAVGSLPLLRSMEALSGFARTQSGWEFDFTSVASRGVAYGRLALVAAISTIAAYCLLPVIEYLLLKRKTPDAISGYLANCKLADLDGRFFPVRRQVGLDFNATALAPEIRCSRHYVREMDRKYQKRIPGSPAAREYLQNRLKKCRLLVHSHLFPDEPDGQIGIEFFACTGRAIEVALLRAAPRHFVLSPYEHPTVQQVCRWMESNGTGKTWRRGLRIEDYDLPWSTQLTLSLDRFEKMVKNSQGPIALIISEVCYLTGSIIPVQEVVARCRKVVPSPRILSVIVDGAHSLGASNRRVSLEDVDFYIGSGHKWMLSGEPSGILVSRLDSQKSPRLSPYDSWGTDVPISPLPFSGIAQLRASLEMMSQLDVEARSARSIALLDRVKRSVECWFHAVGQENGLQKIPALALSPKTGWRWKRTGKSLQQQFDSRHSRVAVFVLPGGQNVVRLLFPFFLDVPEITEMIKLLEDSIEST